MWEERGKRREREMEEIRNCRKGHKWKNVRGKMRGRKVKGREEIEEERRRENRRREKGI